MYRDTDIDIYRYTHMYHGKTSTLRQLGVKEGCGGGGGGGDHNVGCNQSLMVTQDDHYWTLMSTQQFFVTIL